MSCRICLFHELIEALKSDFIVTDQLLGFICDLFHDFFAFVNFIAYFDWYEHALSEDRCVHG
jgi:hypothetical protein